MSSIYNNNAKIKLEALGLMFPIEMGVRQGDLLSPILFMVVLEAIINNNLLTIHVSLNLLITISLFPFNLYYLLKQIISFDLKLRILVF